MIIEINWCVFWGVWLPIIGKETDDEQYLKGVYIGIKNKVLMSRFRITSDVTKYNLIKHYT